MITGRVVSGRLADYVDEFCSEFAVQGYTRDSASIQLH